MKVLAINGSPHKDGGTNFAMSLVINELKKQDIEVEMLHVGYTLIRGCVGCNACSDIEKLEDKRCIFTSDIVNIAIEKSQTCDGILIGTPVYYAGIAGSMKAFLDRFFYAASENLNYKVGASVAVLRRSGGVDAFQQLNNYFNLAKVIITPSHYWNVVHGSSTEEVMQDEEGVQIMESLGKNMAWLLKTIDYGKKNIEMPKLDERAWTNFIR